MTKSQASITNRRLGLSVCTILLASLSVGAFSTNESQRDNEVKTSLSVFDSATVADIERVSSDTTWDSTVEEIDSKTTAAAGWNVCQEAMPAYFRRPGAPTSISPGLHNTIKTLTPTVQTQLAGWIDLVFGPVADGVSPDEVKLYVNYDRCGFVRADSDGQRMSIAEIFSSRMVAQ